MGIQNGHLSRCPKLQKEITKCNRERKVKIDEYGRKKERLWQ